MTKTVQILLFLIYIISGLLCILAYDLNKTTKQLELLKKEQYYSEVEERSLIYQLNQCKLLYRRQ